MNRDTGMLMHDSEGNHGERRVGLFVDCRGLCTSMISYVVSKLPRSTLNVPICGHWWGC